MNIPILMLQWGALMTQSWQASGLHVLHISSKKYEKLRLGLYHNDALACFVYNSILQADRIKKYFITIFKEDLKFHQCRFENIPIRLCSCKYYTLKISHSQS